MGVSTTHRIYNLSMWILIYSFSNTYYVWAACELSGVNLHIDTHDKIKVISFDPLTQFGLQMND